MGHRGYVIRKGQVMNVVMSGLVGWGQQYRYRFQYRFELEKLRRNNELYGLDCVI